MSAATGTEVRAVSETPAARPLRVAVVGISERETDGVRDHATLLAQGLASEGVACTLHWLQRGTLPLRATAGRIGEWRRRLARELEAERPDAILLHYSVFPFSQKGLPLFVAPILATLRGAGVPIVSVMHEFAYPWRYGGWRGLVWAVSQRAALVYVMRTTTSAIVTADFRVQWLRTRRWLPRRTVRLAPVFSNLPAPTSQPPAERDEEVIGLFGYGYQGAAAALILDALARLRHGGAPARLLLAGAPGADSPTGAQWRRMAAERGLGGALDFTGALPAQELSNALAGCEVLLFADTVGPTARKGTLAGDLASGRPVVAIDGPLTWSALVQADAARVAAPGPVELAATLGELLADREQRERLGARGRSFYLREMALERTVSVTRELIAEALEGR